MPQALDYASNVYLAVSLTPSSAYLTNAIQLNPTSFTNVNINDLGTVGSLPDVKLLSVPKEEWETVGEDILRALKQDKENVVTVELQVPKQRVKRGGDEL